MRTLQEIEINIAELKLDEKHMQNSDAIAWMVHDAKIANLEMIANPLRAKAKMDSIDESILALDKEIRSGRHDDKTNMILRDLLEEQKDKRQDAFESFLELEDY